MIKELLKANPDRAQAVINTLTAVTIPAPYFLVTLSESRMETIVPEQIIIDIIPAHERGTAKSADMTGHADPSRESGKPRLIKERYMIESSREYIGEIFPTWSRTAHRQFTVFIQTIS